MTTPNNERMIKGRLFVYWVEVNDARDTSKKFLQERLAHFGEIVTIPRDEDIALGEREGMFFSDAERTAIENGTYRGLDAAQVATAQKAGTIDPPTSPQPAVQPDIDIPLLPDGGIDVENATDEEIAVWIGANPNKGGNPLNVTETVQLAADNKAFAEKILDAESLATSNQPRNGVKKGIEAILADRTTRHGHSD